MKFPGAPYGLKMACCENPKRVYGSRSRSPSTRIGNFAGYRKAWIDAQEYLKKWMRFEKALGEYETWRANNEGESDYKERPSPPKRNLQMETLVGVLKGEILVHNHCYRADEMAQIIDLSREFGY